MHGRIVAAVLLCGAGTLAAQSKWVHPGPDGKLVYAHSPHGDHIIDFSYAGYRAGGVALPNVRGVKLIAPSGADDTAAIQAAIDEVSKLPLKDGHRGALVLGQGVFHCAKTLTISADGVVLRGAGTDANAGTTIELTGEPHLGISVEGKLDIKKFSATTIADAYVPSGTMLIHVADASKIHAGDIIQIAKPVTAAWLKFMGMDTMVRDGKAEKWVGTNDLTARRRVASVSGNAVTLEVPLTDDIDAKFLNGTPATITTVQVSGQIAEDGVELLRIVAPQRAVALGKDPEFDGIVMKNAVDSWIRSVDLEDTTNSIGIDGGTERITVAQVDVLQRVPVTTPAKPFDFSCNGTQVLFDRVSGKGNEVFYMATQAREQGPVVLLHSKFAGNGHVQPHQRWSTGLLVDGSEAPGGGIDLMDRGTMGSGHGWAIGWSVLWNNAAGDFVVQMPPGSANWSIGDRGPHSMKPQPTTGGAKNGPDMPSGIIESAGKPVEPASLYLEQLKERLGPAAVEGHRLLSCDLPKIAAVIIYWDAAQSRSAEKNELAQTPAQVAAAIEQFLAEHEAAAVLEDGKVIFDLRSAKYSLSTEHGRCTLHLWSSEQNMVRRVVSATLGDGALRLATQRFGHASTKLLELVASHERRTPTTRENTRIRYGKTLERVLAKQFAPFTCDTLRTAMDLERSFGPAYARGSLTHGKHAWAVIGVNAQESVATIDGILTLGILWLHICRERGDGRRLYQGLKVIVPRGMAMLTLARMAWLNNDAAKWELWEFDEKTEDLTERDTGDIGNVRTRLVHHPDERAAAERFAAPVAELMTIVPPEEQARVETRLRSTAELAFLLHGLEFARARVGLAPNSFAQTLELTVGTGPLETPLNDATREELSAFVAELFARRRAFVPSVDFGRRGRSPLRRIGGGGPQAAHSRLNIGGKGVEAAGNPTQDPLYRAAPERWLESMLRRDLAPLTRNVAPAAKEGRAIPRLDPQHVYAQVPAIAGASDRGMLDLLGVTADGRLAVIELKADDDLHFALQGLDYWIRVRHHHLQAPDGLTGMGEFQRHGYFRGIELSPLPPRLYLVAPALRIHPVTETVLRYFSPRVPWNLLALDERWRQEIRVVWRKSGGR